MDIYRFFNSKDVASYLRGIGYEFSMPEASFIVYCSLGATLNEKMVAWLEIAETMPDCAMEKRPWLEQILSTRAFLSDYVDLKRRELGIFCEQDGASSGVSTKSLASDGKTTGAFSAASRPASATCGSDGLTERTVPSRVSA